MDPLGNPILQKESDGTLTDNKGNKVNEKGYLIDSNGNVINKRGYKVFSKVLLEEDGDIPKVFRSGLIRKDTNDSFNQLMNEIEHLEKLHSQASNGHIPDQNRNKKGGDQSKRGKEEIDEERMNQRIDQILEEDNDGDDDMLMKELEDLARYKGEDEQMFDEEVISDGGNTSYDSMMGETPSNYNALNQMQHNTDQVRSNAKRMRAAPVPEDLELESDDGRELQKKRRKKKKKTKQPKEDNVNYRDLMMAAAYKGIPASQLEKYKEAYRQVEKRRQ